MSFGFFHVFFSALVCINVPGAIMLSSSRYIHSRKEEEELSNFWRPGVIFHFNKFCPTAQQPPQTSPKVVQLIVSSKLTALRPGRLAQQLLNSCNDIATQTVSHLRCRNLCGADADDRCGASSVLAQIELCLRSTEVRTARRRRRGCNSVESLTTFENNRETDFCVDRHFVQGSYKCAVRQKKCASRL